MSIWVNIAILLPWTDQNKPTACMYNTCRITVAPNRGWRHAGLVFCSDEHAAAEQADMGI